MAQQVKIVRIARVPSLTKERAGQIDRLVVYQAGQTVDGRFVPSRSGFVMVPDQGFTVALAEAAIKKDLEEQGKLEGHTFQA